MAKKATATKARAVRNTETVRIGIIGGSGLYNMPGLEKPRKCASRRLSAIRRTRSSSARWKASASRFLRGTRAAIAFCPTEINYRANIHAMKQLGVERIISVSAVGSLQEELRPLDFMIPDQFFDRTRHRVSTFFGDGVVAHVGFDKPVCGATRGSAGRRMRPGESEGASRRHLRLHGRAAILDAGRSARASPIAL